MDQPAIKLPPRPQVRLVEANRALNDPHPREWSVSLPEKGWWKVTGVAGSGVSSFVVDTALAKIAAGADPNGVLVLTASKPAAARLRKDLHSRILGLGENYVSHAPLVRSIHSLAFALLRDQREEDLRLITGAEQDGVIRQLLAGHVADDRGTWPEELRPALGYVGFARQLRDFLLRAVERGLSPEDLEELGGRYERPLWSAAGSFLREYEQTMQLSGSYHVSASELVDMVLEKPVPQRWHTVLVDDSQHLDPKSGELISRILPDPAHGLAVIAGDPDQSIFHFRGANPRFLKNFPAPDSNVIDLQARFRKPKQRIFQADSDQIAQGIIADTVRRAHLEEEVDYSDIAIIVRSAGSVEKIRRGLLGAGVPVHQNPTDLVLSEQPVVAALLLGIKSLNQELEPGQMEELLVGPIGGADPITLRRLHRGLRRYAPDTRANTTLSRLLNSAEPLPDFEGLLTDRELNILTSLRNVLGAGRKALASGASTEEVLWEVWQATGLSERLLSQSLRGGAAGSQADRDLDAMMALFDAAGDFVERRPGAGSIETFIQHIEEQELPTGVRDRRTATPEAVSLLTAHGVVGQEFRRVIVAGVQEGSWPSLGETGSLFGQEDLLDLLDRNIDPRVIVSHAATRLEEERRLFHVATTRATEELTIIAVDNLEANEPAEPSRFIEEYAQTHDLVITCVSDEDMGAQAAAQADPYIPGTRVLSSPHLIGELRRAVCDPKARQDLRTQAARQLAKLTRAGISGANPHQWWSARRPSTDEPLTVNLKLSPSKIEQAIRCPLRAVLDSFDPEPTSSMQIGNIAHYFFEALGNGVDEEYARLLCLDAYRGVIDEPAWNEKAVVADFERTLLRTAEWLEASRSAFTQAGVEVPINVDIETGVKISGRMDRLEKDEQGNYYVVDLKTTKYPLTKAEAQENPQLRAYQLALSRGELIDGRIITAKAPDKRMNAGGGTLVYPASGNKTVPTRDQARISEEELLEFSELLPEIAASLTGPFLEARENSNCNFCPVRSLCPIKPEGRMLTHG